MCLDKSLFKLEKDFESCFNIAKYEGESSPFSGGNWDSIKLTSLQNMSGEFVHIQSCGRYEDTTQAMAKEEYAEAHKITDRAFNDMAVDNRKEGGNGS